jgi:antitoxin component of RelBE/YafQ-DinJ toxin-antitoxin module
MDMGDAMVTGRMSAEKKRDGLRVLKREGLNASQAINLLFTRLIDEQSADFLRADQQPSREKWQQAATFVDILPRARTTRFDDMTKAQIKQDCLKHRGLM